VTTHSTNRLDGPLGACPNKTKCVLACIRSLSRSQSQAACLSVSPGFNRVTKAFSKKYQRNRSSGSSGRGALCHHLGPFPGSKNLTNSQRVRLQLGLSDRALLVCTQTDRAPCFQTKRPTSLSSHTKKIRWSHRHQWTIAPGTISPISSPNAGWTPASLILQANMTPIYIARQRDNRCRR
jgi:hypothetical protein